MGRGHRSSGTPVAVEYDGAYWHANPEDIDTARSLDLLAAGYVVVRLREAPLPALPMTARYPGFVIHSTTPNPDRVIEAVAEWVHSREPEVVEPLG